MKYEYPIIKNISDVLFAMEGREEFIIAERDGFKVVNYLVNFQDTFPSVIGENISEEEKRIAAMRRELRGIKFEFETGNIICRPLQKFFNANEKEETSTSHIDFSYPHVILDKLDGSFISPFIVRERIIYGTKMGETNVSALVSNHVQNKPQYEEFNKMLISKGFTPTYEYIGPDNRIVIQYKESKLILLAIRNMLTGEYHNYETMLNMALGFDIPVVKAWVGNAQNMEQLIDFSRHMIDSEGYVLRFSSGYSVKMKADEYVLKHKVKDSISQEKNLVELIFSEKMDDVYSTLDEEDAIKVKTYADNVLGHAMVLAAKLTEIVVVARAEVGSDKKRFACEIVPQYKVYSNLLFSMWDGKDAFKTIQDYILKNCGTQSKIDSIRHVLGNLIWNDIYTSVNLND